MSQGPEKGEGGWRDWLAPALGALLVVAVLPVAAYVRAADQGMYYRLVQEDGWLEWLTAWAFLAAGVLFAWGGVRRRRETGGIPWFGGAVAAFCLFVFLEEISWGQRLLGYRPPSYFLRENYQQELNLHNLVDSSLRQVSFMAVTAGYGVLLPLLASVDQVHRLFRKLEVRSPPAGLAPAFAVGFLWYLVYPWEFSGELVEAMLGIGFFLAGWAAWRRPDSTHPLEQEGLTPVTPWLAGSLALLLASGGMVHLQQQRLQDQPELIEAARTETRALVADLQAWSERIGTAPSECGAHLRLFTFVSRFRAVDLVVGRFSRLVSQGLPRERATYFIDPWNSPYWMLHSCAPDGSREMVLIYSLGPNRRRDSSERELAGDDVGTFLKRPEVPGPAYRGGAPGG